MLIHTALPRHRYIEEKLSGIYSRGGGCISMLLVVLIRIVVVRDSTDPIQGKSPEP